MIDTIKIYSEIDKKTYDKIYSLSVIKTSYDNSTKDIFYEIINDHLEGSYSSKLSVRLGCGSKYGFVKLGYFIEIEGSYHKIVKGYNSHNGYYDLQFISQSLIDIVELSYNIKLPDVEYWYLQRCDIAICFDLKKQDNVKSYINSLSRCSYPRRNAKFFYDESIYLSGTTTTLKIYNKLLEFKKHDLKKFLDSNFDIIEYINTIKGFVRFECEIKKKMLKNIYENEKNIKLINIKYEDLRKVWCDEFMKLLQLVDIDLGIVRGREEVYKRLYQLYKPAKANLLYNFYCSIQLNGLKDVKLMTSSSTYYRNIKDLKNAKIDFSQSYKIEKIYNCDDIFYFNPFEYKEVV